MNESDAPLNNLSKQELDFLGQVDKYYEKKRSSVELEVDDMCSNIYSMMAITERLYEQFHEYTESKHIGVPREEVEEKAQVLALKGAKSARMVRDSYIELYKFCEENSYFWHNCSARLYEINYPSFKDSYLKKFPFSNEVDLLQKEIKYYLKADNTEVNTAHRSYQEDYLSILNIRKYFTDDTLEFFYLINKRKLEFLDKKLAKFGFYYDVDDSGDFPKPKFKELIAEEEKELSYQSLPKFNVQQRYHLFKDFGFDKIIDKLDMPQMSKYKLLAILMSVNPDNAKRLYSNTYKSLNTKDEKYVVEYIEKQLFKK